MRAVLRVGRRDAGSAKCQLTPELSRAEGVGLNEMLDRRRGIMRTDTEYLRGLADNENLPSLMRDTLRTAAAEIETLRADWVRMEWLADRKNTIGNVQLPTMCVMNNMHSLRGAIDEAMRLDPAIWAEIGGADAGETFNAV